MSGIIKGYENDIFISYCQRDNKYDGWVTEFVEILKGELEYTFKETISVYFDVNQHDELADVSDVDETFKDKLKCLVFIPIISRTYCDPKSYTWEHELKAFVEQASRDQFGIKVKLPGGNFANRVLPVLIHEPDNEGLKLCDSVMSGMLRGNESVFKEPGETSSLKPDDKDYNRPNLNKTNYRNLVNKTVLEITDIIRSIKAHDTSYKSIDRVTMADIQKRPGENKITRRKFVKGIAVTTVCYACLSFDSLTASEEKGENKIEGVKGNERLAAACGTYCGACPAYIAKHSEDEQIKMRLQKRSLSKPIKGLKSIPDPGWMDGILCDGCLSGGQIAIHCQSCSIKICSSKKQSVTRCSDCKELPCYRITNMINTGLLHRAEYLPNLEKIREMGVQEWVKYEEERWLCHRCGQPMSWYDTECTGCGEPRSGQLFPLTTNKIQDI
jgi:hypothetical protein